MYLKTQVIIDFFTTSSVSGWILLILLSVAIEIKKVSELFP